VLRVAAACELQLAGERTGEPGHHLVQKVGQAEHGAEQERARQRVARLQHDGPVLPDDGELPVQLVLFEVLSPTIRYYNDQHVDV
jgi:hypothetical protein